MHDMFLYIWYISCDMFFSATVCFETHIIHPWGCIRKYNALTWLTLAHTMDHSVPILCKLFVTFLEAASACVAWKSVSMNMVWYRLQSIKLHSRIQCVYIEVCISAILLLAPFTPRYALHTQTQLCAMPIKSDYFYSVFFCRRIWSHIKMLRAATVCKISGHLSFFRLHSQIRTLHCTGTQN